MNNEMQEFFYKIPKVILTAIIGTQTVETFIIATLDDTNNNLEMKAVEKESEGL